MYLKFKPQGLEVHFRWGILTECLCHVYLYTFCLIQFLIQSPASSLTLPDSLAGWRSNLHCWGRASGAQVKHLHTCQSFLTHLNSPLVYFWVKTIQLLQPIQGRSLPCDVITTVWTASNQLLIVCKWLEDSVVSDFMTQRSQAKADQLADLVNRLMVVLTSACLLAAS